MSAQPDNAPIRIDSDSQFDLDHGVALGAGTADAPYVIRDMNVVGSPTHVFTGIAISNTTAYVILRNITISGAGIGIYVNNARNVVVTDCTLSNNDFAVAIHHSRDCSVLNNSLFDNGYAISIYQSYRIDVFGNTYMNNDVDNSLEIPTWVVVWFGALAIVATALLALLAVVMVRRSYLRRRTSVRILARVSSCVLIQSLVILVVLGYFLPEFNKGDLSWDSVVTLAIVTITAGIIAIVLASLYRSHWVEPQFR